MGFNLGPSLLTPPPGDDKNKPRHGYFFSVWKRQADGKFKVVLDIGSDTSGPASWRLAGSVARGAHRAVDGAGECVDREGDGDAARAGRGADRGDREARRGRCVWRRAGGGLPRVRQHVRARARQGRRHCAPEDDRRPRRSHVHRAARRGREVSRRRLLVGLVPHPSRDAREGALRALLAEECEGRLAAGRGDHPPRPAASER